LQAVMSGSASHPKSGMGFAPSSSLAIDRALVWLLPLGPGSLSPPRHIYAL
jgi:hypothetical protein